MKPRLRIPGPVYPPHFPATSDASPPTDAISAANPRVIDDSRARKLSTDLKRCTYYETCATYGLNVERVFQDGNVAPAGAGRPLAGRRPVGLCPSFQWV